MDDITSRQISTNPRHQDLLDILSRWSQSVRVYGELNYVLNYDKRFTNQPKFYAEMSDLGRTIEKLVDGALSKLETFLRTFSRTPKKYAYV